MDVIRLGIRVNAIAPGFISTRLRQGITRKNWTPFLRKIPAGRLGNTQDITPLVLFFGRSGKIRFYCRTNFVVDGGQSIDGTIDYMLLKNKMGKSKKGGFNHGVKKETKKPVGIREASECREG